MNFVEPIRDLDLLENICDYLQKTNVRNFILFNMGIYSGLRISDILKLKVRDVKDKNYISMREKKTGKQNRIKINPILKKYIKEYTQDKEPNEFLIKSRNGYNKPIDRARAFQILKDIAQIFNIESLGCHSMRKTFGYHYYKQTKDIATLQKIYNHSSPSITLRYIGIVQDEIDKAFDNFRYF
ncbi:MAG TPA: site-specific integrase [Clostridium perfringens]|nr:site-specific integrase [Clostridium perfringens]